MSLKFLPIILTLSILYSCQERINSNPEPSKIIPVPTVTTSIIPSASISLAPTNPAVTNLIPTITASSSTSVVIIPNSDSTPQPAGPNPIRTATPIIKPTPTVVFQPLPKTNVLLFDTTSQPFGDKSQKSIANLLKLTNILEGQNYTVLFDSIDNIQNLDTIDTIFIISPSIKYSDKNVTRIKDFVSEGKKVFITGEWGGYGNFNVDSANNILKDANLKINQDVIKESDSKNYDLNDEQISIKDIVAHPVTTGVTNLLVYSSASVGALTTENIKTKVIASSSSTSFTIKAETYKSGFIAVSELGNGKVIAAGDSSFLLDSDTNANGIANIDEANNKTIILNMLKW